MAEIVQTVEGRAIGRLTYLEPLSLLKVLKSAGVGGRVGEAVDAHVAKLASNVPADELLEIVEVVLRVEATHFIATGLPGVVDVEVAVKAGVDNEGMCHCDALGLHGVLLRVYELSEVLVVKI